MLMADIRIKEKCGVLSQDIQPFKLVEFGCPRSKKLRIILSFEGTFQSAPKDFLKAQSCLALLKLTGTCPGTSYSIFVWIFFQRGDNV